jgi:hypothetical protein
MKKGDLIMVYGAVWRNFDAPTSDDLYYFLDGLKAKILDVVNKDELTVEFPKGKHSMRHPQGTFEVHPKQCRKIK